MVRQEGVGFEERQNRTVQWVRSREAAREGSVWRIMDSLSHHPESCHMVCERWAGDLSMEMGEQHGSSGVGSGVSGV